MAINDIQVIKGGYGTQEFVCDNRDYTGATLTLKPGEPVKKSTNTAILLATGDPEIGTDTVIGIVAKESTESATVDGVVLVEMVGPGTILRGKPTTTASMDTASELLGLKMDYVTFDLTTVYFTIDEDEGDDPNVHGLCILDGDIDKLTLDVAVHANITLFAPLTGQTMD